MKWNLIIGSTLLIASFGAVIYVWALYQDMHRTLDVYVPNNVSSTTKHAESDTQPENSGVGSTTTQEASVVIDTTKLGTTQQDMLKAFGYDNKTITITPTMIACAEKAVGKDRLDAITGGAAPSPLEAAKLLPCFK